MQFDFETELKEREKASDEIINAYQLLYSTQPAGIVLLDQCQLANIFAPTYREGSPTRTAFEEGMRRVVLRTLRFSGYEDRMLGVIIHGPHK